MMAEIRVTSGRSFKIFYLKLYLFFWWKKRWEDRKKVLTLQVLWSHALFFLGGGLLSSDLLLSSQTGLRPGEDDSERSDMAFLKDLLSPGPGAGDDFSREWQDAFGIFEPPSAAATSAGAAGSGTATGPSSNPPSPTGFLPSQLLDHSLSSTGQPQRTLLDGWAHCRTAAWSLTEQVISQHFHLSSRLGDPTHVPSSAPAAPFRSEPASPSDSKLSTYWYELFPAGVPVCASVFFKVKQMSLSIDDTF